MTLKTLQNIVVIYVFIYIWELNEGVCLKFKKIIMVYKDFKLNVNLDKCCHENTPEYTQLAEHDI
jgi:hypothetical protein